MVRIEQSKVMYSTHQLRVRFQFIHHMAIKFFHSGIAFLNILFEGSHQGPEGKQAVKRRYSMVLYRHECSSGKMKQCIPKGKGSYFQRYSFGSCTAKQMHVLFSGGSSPVQLQVRFRQ